MSAATARRFAAFCAVAHIVPEMRDLKDRASLMLQVLVLHPSPRPQADEAMLVKLLLRHTLDPADRAPLAQLLAAAAIGPGDHADWCAWAEKLMAQLWAPTIVPAPSPETSPFEPEGAAILEA